MMGLLGSNVLNQGWRNDRLMEGLSFSLDSTKIHCVDVWKLRRPSTIVFSHKTTSIHLELVDFQSIYPCLNFSIKKTITLQRAIFSNNFIIPRKFIQQINHICVISANFAPKITCSSQAYSFFGQKSAFVGDKSDS